MSQQARKQHEGTVVRRLTIGTGAAALGLAWCFTSSAATAAPIAFGVQPTAGPQEVVGVEQLDDRAFVRTVHVPAPSAGGVAAGGSARAGQAVTAAAPAQPVRVAAPAPAAPAPAPVATTGGSTPAK